MSEDGLLRASTAFLVSLAELLRDHGECFAELAIAKEGAGVGESSTLGGGVDAGGVGVEYEIDAAGGGHNHDDVLLTTGIEFPAIANADGAAGEVGWRNVILEKGGEGESLGGASESPVVGADVDGVAGSLSEDSVQFVALTGQEEGVRIADEAGLGHVAASVVNEGMRD